MNINILIAGPTSVGKSTLTNLLFVEQFSDMKIKRTTAIPQVYHEVNDIKDVSDLSTIILTNRQINTNIMNQTEDPNYKLNINDIGEIHYYVPKLYDVVNLKDDVLLTIYDTPGLNDSRTKDVYCQYINDNFNKYDVVIFVLDINSAMNTSDEHDILKMLVNNIKNNKKKHNIDTNLIVLLNKCDDVIFNEQTNTYELDTELSEMYIQANTIIRNTVDELYPVLQYDILKMSCEDSYIYRMYKKYPSIKLDEHHLNKFGANEYGKARWTNLSEDKKQSQIEKIFNKFDYTDRIKMSGFQTFKDLLSNVFSNDNQYKFLLNHVKFNVKLLLDYSNCASDISNELKKYLDYLCVLINKFDKPTAEYRFMFDYIDKYMTDYESKYFVNNHNNYDINKTILIYGTYIKFKNYFIINRPFISDQEKYNTIQNMVEFRIKELLKYINIHWIEKTDNCSLSLDDLLSCFDKLYENKYEILNELISRKLSNVSFYRYIYENHPYTNEICEVLDTIETRYNLSHEFITDLAFKIISNSYTLFASKNNNTVLNKMTGYWHQVICKSSNKYYDQILSFKNMNTINSITKINTYEVTPCNFLSDYIVERIKHEYPTDIIKHDDLINKYYQTINISEDNQTTTNKNIQILSTPSETELMSHSVFLQIDNKMENSKTNNDNNDINDNNDNNDNYDNIKKEYFSGNDDLSDEIDDELNSDYEDTVYVRTTNYNNVSVNGTI